MSNGMNIKDNIDKRNYRAHVCHVGLANFPNGIPLNGKYVTLGGKYCNTITGELLRHSEIDKVIREGLATTKQIISIDRSKEIVRINERNRLGIRNIHNNASTAIEKLRARGEIISFLNLDFMGSPECLSDELADIIEILNYQPPEHLIIVCMNFVVRPRIKKFRKSFKNINSRLLKNKRLKSLVKLRRCLNYRWLGTKKPIGQPFDTKASKTPMRTIYFVKRSK